MFEAEVLDQKIEETEFSVIDVETTGMSPVYSRIIEIGIVKIRNLQIVDTYRSFVNPGMEIPFQITKLTGIKNDDVISAPYLDELFPEVQTFIGNSVVCGHNLQFDLSFINRSLYHLGMDKIKNPTICTLKIARRMYPLLPSRALSALTDHFKITHKNVHRALGDASVTAKVLLKIINELKTEKNCSTITELINFQYLPALKKYRFIKKKLLNDLAKLPDLPGVYFFKNSKDEILYIGKAKSLKNRVKSYFSSTVLRKTRKIIKQASKIDFQTTNSELTALIAEAELIKTYKPPLNVQLKKYTQTYFIKITNHHNFPRPEICKQFDFDGNDYFGPYNNIDTVNTLHQLISKTFSLRECDDKEFAKHKDCYLSQICRCLGPCTEENLLDEYKKELEKVYEFLSGKNQFAVNRLVNKMKELSLKQKYEEAAQIRDLVNLVLSQIQKSSILAEPVNTANALILINGTLKHDFFLLLSGKIFIKDYLQQHIEIEYDFETILDDYFNGAISMFQKVENKDLEKIKIALSWLIKNRNAIKIYYLKDYHSKEELFHGISGRHYSLSRKELPEFNLRTMVK